MIAYFAQDLVWATRIKGLAEDLGIEARPVRTIEMLDARLADSPVRGLIVDLDQPETALALIHHLRARENAPEADSGSKNKRIRVAAFGPHVETNALRAAREAGADTVLTRGSFHHNLPEVLRQLDSETEK